MLPLHTVQEIKRLLDEEKVSQRKIAKLLRVSRGTVQAIASGRRGVYGREKASADDDLICDSPPQRCTGCGMLVTMPCVYCRAQAYMMRKKQFGAAAKSEPYRRAA